MTGQPQQSPKLTKPLAEMTAVEKMQQWHRELREQEARQARLDLQATSLPLVSLKQNAKRIDNLFLKFSAFYGHSWRSLFQSDDFLNFVKCEWKEALACFDDAVFIEAISCCRDFFENYAPTLPQFIKVCKELRSRKNDNELRMKSRLKKHVDYRCPESFKISTEIKEFIS